jgi:curved DNA-binding protein CbpA
MTHYQILGVSPESSHQEIKYNYRNLVKQYHPDLNPSEEAKLLIVKITEAYEVLSDPSKKMAYDWALLSNIITHQSKAPTQPPISEREQYKRDYIRRKREQDQLHWESLFQLKVKFYKFQRYFAYLFCLVGTIYTYDYFFTTIKGGYELKEVRHNRYESGGSLGFLKFKTDRSFYDAATKNHVRYVNLHYSRLFNIPVGVSIDHLGYYKFSGTFHALNNIPAVLLLIFAAMLFAYKEYSDWVLTIGLLPFFILAFLLILTYLSLAGLKL